jgi:predicted dienelactone hydrolase
MKKILFIWGLGGVLTAAAPMPAMAYDPLAHGPAGTAVELTVKDATRNREIPLRIVLPAERKPAPVLLFSHGLGGSREGSAYLGEHWSARGYVTVYLQHPGSDTSVWQGKAVNERMGAMRSAASLKNFRDRVADVKAVLDQLEQWNRSEQGPLSGRLDLQHVGMSGHSFGAVTTEAVSGEKFPIVGTRWTDVRIKAAVAFSPSVPKKGNAAEAFGSVKIPWLLMTGTKDNAPIGQTDAASRRLVYPALPPGDKYELVLDKAEHSAFTDRALPGDVEKRNPNHHRAVLALTTAFWDACLKNEPEAKAWLDGSGPRSVLETQDAWQRK